MGRPCVVCGGPIKGRAQTCSAACRTTLYRRRKLAQYPADPLAREAWEAERADLIGGEWREGPAALLPLQSALWQFARGQRAFRSLFDRTPTTWGRRRYGFSTQIPQILARHGYHAAFHVALDDGLYPDAEQSKIRWEGCDGSTVDAITRIPLAADGAASFLRFPARMAESMQQDHVAAVLFARWPEVKAPWFEDFRRMHRYSPILGRFVTMHEFFERTDSPGRISKFEEKEYLSPYLIQAVARQEPDPIGRFAAIEALMAAGQAAPG
jgi:alpha-mannosidase